MKNLIAWVEIPAEDFNRAVNFYTAILNIELNPLDFGKEKMACFPGGEGAISLSPGFKTSKNGVLVSFNVVDLDNTLKKIKSYGGKIIQSKTKIEAEGRGYFATFFDSEGNKLGIYSDS